MVKTEKRGFIQWWRDFMEERQVGKPIPCPECKGSGMIVSDEPVYDDDPYCSMSGCGGGGPVSYPSYPCGACGGSGKVLETRESYRKRKGRSLNGGNERGPKDISPSSVPVIKVVGVGGFGCNAVGRMASSDMHGVAFIVANTDAQPLALSPVNHTIHLGSGCERNTPENGRMTAVESLATVKEALSGANLVIIVAGMGGAAGTGASPVIADAAREIGALTVGVVTTPMCFEGEKRRKAAEAGIAALHSHADFLMIIPLEDIYQAAPKQAAFTAVFARGSDLACLVVRCISDTLMQPSLIAFDFAAMVSVLKGADMAVLGSGSASGENRARIAAKQALACPMLEEAPIGEARALLLSITADPSFSLDEAHEIAHAFMAEMDEDAYVALHAAIDDSLNEEVRVVFIATIT